MTTSTGPPTLPLGHIVCLVDGACLGNPSGKCFRGWKRTRQLCAANPSPNKVRAKVPEVRAHMFDVHARPDTTGISAHA